MRIKAISLSWFRGAADTVFMEPACKSMVVYGVNGSGKSSFVDAIEYGLNDGRIGHLAHEYSGKKQEHAVPNTHKPKGAKTEFSVEFCDGSTTKTAIFADGSRRTSGPTFAWDYRRTVLRQDEVAAFIQNTKGGKYSELLPLFGLEQMEFAAENLRQLGKNVESLFQLESRKGALDRVETKRKASFGSDTDDQIIKRVEVLHAKYSSADLPTTDAALLCTKVSEAIEAKIDQLSFDQRRHLALRAAAELEIKGSVEAVRAAIVTLANAADPLITQKLAVLQPTETFLAELPAAGEVQCPACGQAVPLSKFREHITSELERLRAIRQTFNARNTAMGNLSGTVKSLKLELAKSELKSWREGLAEGGLTASFAYLDGIDAEKIRTTCSEASLQQIEGKLLTLVAAADSASTNAPAAVQELLNARNTVDVARATFQAKEECAQVARAEALAILIKFLEKTTRDQIRTRSKVIIADISDDIKRMWSILHPGEGIEDVHLYLPNEADKAIDIGLKFYGKQQQSPRLTLSEGYRNSLGLCIFLAMAKREAVNDRPVILDDVVISLDRNHRGMIVELLDKEFAARQVIIFTHDRNWYTELRQQLDEKTWKFKPLLPYESPEIGIRWSDKSTPFDDARAHLKDRPDSAGNDARKIMDVELALIAERLQIELPYLRLDRNDRRTAHEFLEGIVGVGSKCFQKRAGDKFAAHAEAIEKLKSADKLIVSWGNISSHSFDVVGPEATKLIDACENALATFKCEGCGKPVWFAVAEGPEWVQCQCGGIRWRYGKG